MKRLTFIATVACCGWLSTLTALPCTTFVLEGGGRIYFGRNLDWDWETGLVLANPRNVEKTALVTPGHSPVRWTAKYGSVTFNQFGQDMPFGGMNEAGLVVEQMMLFETRYPAPDARPEISMLEWIQYQLDTCRTVAEVVATDKTLRLEQPTVPARIHYLVCDAQGDCATIEFLNGEMVCHRGTNLPCRALANDPYDKSVAFAREHPVAAGPTAKLKDPQSLARFTLAAARAARFQPASPREDVAYAFETLEQVCQGNATVWRIVYDATARQIHYRTRSNPQVRTLDLKALNFSCARPVQCLDIQAQPSAAGRLPFQDLTEARHRQYLESFTAQESLKQTLGDLTPMIEGLLQTVRSNRCVGQ